MLFDYFRFEVDGVLMLCLFDFTLMLVAGFVSLFFVLLVYGVMLLRIDCLLYGMVCFEMRCVWLWVLRILCAP